MPGKFQLHRRSEANSHRGVEAIEHDSHSADGVTTDRMKVIEELQHMVDGGVAEWQVSANGSLHITLLSGERFLLDAHVLTRVA
jgi:flavin-binding protein dodecin